MSENLSDQINQWIRQKIESVGPYSCDIEVHSEDQVHFEVQIISDVFEGLSRVKRQQLVYASLSHAIVQGLLHAVVLRTYTPTEWMSWKNKNE